MGGISVRCMMIDLQRSNASIKAQFTHFTTCICTIRVVPNPHDYTLMG